MARPDFATLTLPHMDALYRTACRLTTRASEAEDLVQETYLEGFRCYASLRDPERSRAWLFRILHNLWNERYARDVARVTAALTNGGAFETPEVVESGNPEQTWGGGGYSDEVTRALADLPEEFRTALLLVTVEEMSYSEVAEVMACPIGTVRSRVARGRALLGAALATFRAEALAKAKGTAAAKSATEASSGSGEKETS